VVTPHREVVRDEIDTIELLDELEREHIEKPAILPKHLPVERSDPHLARFLEKLGSRRHAIRRLGPQARI
jgi:hypothetical protein